MATLQAEAIGWQASSRTGVVAAGSAESVAAGLGVLETGGNAADAAVATIFALIVTDHGDCSIGGEVPLLIYEARTQSVKALSGQGRAPLSPDAIAWYMRHGIPGNGDIKMAPVPSVVDLCLTTLQRYGTRALSEVLPPTLALLDRGTEPWHPKLAVTLRKLLDEEARTPGSREAKLQSAGDRFYGRHPQRNDIAEDLEADYIAKGGFLRRRDLAAHVTTIEEPVRIQYQGYTICKCGPWTQGPYLCQALRLLEGFDLKAMGQGAADYIHVVIEAVKLAMADRDTYYGDPDFVSVPMAALLSDAYTQLRRPLIDPQQASQEARPGDPLAMKALKDGGVFRPAPGGTTTCVIADRWGNVVAATPSANVPKTPRDGGAAGITFGNRLRSLNTTPGHPNCIQAGKRPRITLTPTLVLKDGKPIMAVSVAGGDMQDQTTLNLLLNVIEFGMLPAAAVTAPRFGTAHHQDSFDPNPAREQTFKGPGTLSLNETIAPAVRDELARRGHTVQVKAGAIAAPVMLLVDPATGLMYAAGDPQARRHAAGLP
jgi:gamma-glutamyltranspeptidase / glutathione hydrolase